MYQNFYYSILIWSSTCFGRHTAHYQEPKTALAASGFSYVKGCWTCSWWAKSTNYKSNNLPRIKTRGCQCSFRLLTMGGVSPGTCWASYKYGIIKFSYIVAPCWIFLYKLYYNARIHEHQVYMQFICHKHGVTSRYTKAGNLQIA
jgi:hypothetical protein